MCTLFSKRGAFQILLAAFVAAAAKMGRRGMWAAVLILSSMLAICRGSLMAVDLGSEFIKVSLIKPGRTPISIVVNEMSKRKTPALVGFAPDGERLLGEEAFSVTARYPETVYARARDLLGKTGEDETLKAMLEEHMLPYKLVPHPSRAGVAAMQFNSTTAFAAEELVGSILQYARNIAEAQAGGEVPDAVIAVPAWYSQAARQAVIDAAALVNIKVLALINSHTAAALQFGIERDFSDVTKHAILYDMGSGTTVVALVRYSSYNVKEAGKPKPISQLEVLDVDWDATLGANTLDAILARHFTKVFADKHKLDVQSVLSNPKSMAKMKKQVRRTKEMLSANTAGPISVEEFHEGRDFQASITRDEFETLAAPFWEKAVAPLKRIVERSKLKPEELDFVELLGGGTRVPRLQAVLQEALGGRALYRHLDADEAVVLGASLFAANLSTSFRLRKFGMADLSLHGITLRIDESHSSEEKASKQEEPELRALLPSHKKLPVKRLVNWANLTADPLRVSLVYNTSSSYGLPLGATGPAIAEFEVTGIETVIKRYNSSGTVSMRFEAGYDGFLRFDRAEATVEYIVMEEKIVEVKEEAANATAEANATVPDGDTSTDSKESAGAGAEDGDEPADENGNGNGKEEEAAEGGDNSKAEPTTEEGAAAGGANATESDSGVTKNVTTTVKRIQVPKKKIAKVALNVTQRWAYTGLQRDPDALKASQAVVKKWVEAERIKRETAAAKNELEAYIIRMRDDLSEDGGDELLKKVTTPKQRESFLASLAETEDWLYMEGEGEPAQEFRARLAKLDEVGGPMTRRAKEYERRPQILAAARKEVELKSAAVRLWEDARPWISAEERKEAEDLVSAFKSWLDEKEAAQSKKQDHEDPAFLADEVIREYEKLDKPFSRIANKKKPKPPPEPAQPAKESSSEAEGGASSPDGSKAEAEGGDSQQQSGSEAGSKDGSSTQPEGGAAGGGGKEEQAAGGAGGGKEGSQKKAEGGKEEGKADNSKTKKQKEAADAKGKKEADAKAKKEKEAKAKAEKEAKAKADKEAKAKADKAKKESAGKKDAGKSKASPSKDKKSSGKKDSKEL